LKRLDNFIFAISVAAFLLIGASAPSVAQTELKIAAIVNDEVISGLDLHARLLLTIKSSRLEATQAVFSRLAPVVLRNLIDEKLKVQAAKAFNIVVSEADVLQGLASIETRNNVAPGKIDQFLARAGIDKKELLKQIRSDVAWIKLIRRKSLPNIKVSEEDINSAIQEIEQNAGKPEHQVSEIFLPVDKPGDRRRSFSSPKN
jgi:peptidyl-prolyl cis-trans isomerase SurA